MKQALKKAMTASISEVLETMFFMTIDINDGVVPNAFVRESGENAFVSRINFGGKLSGTFFLVIPECMLRSMTETFMGLGAADVSETHLNGTVQEAINMIAGNTFSSLDNTAVYTLGIPEMTDLDSILSDCPEAAPEILFLQVETFSGNIGVKVCFVIE